MRPGVEVDVAKLVDYMSPFTVPARYERFRFTRDWLRGEFARVNDPRNPEFGVALKLDLPAEHLFTHRVWLGMVGVLCQLEAEVAGAAGAGGVPARLRLSAAARAALRAAARRRPSPGPPRRS